MKKHLLDTDICVFFLQRKFSIKEKIDSLDPGCCFISEITLAELMFGSHNSSDYEKHKDDHLKVLSVAKLIRMIDSIPTYAREKVRLKSKGKLIGEFDLLIATTAVHHNMTLVTNNTKHMARVEGLSLENWTIGADNEFL